MIGVLVAQGVPHFALSDMPDVNNWLGRAQWGDPMLAGSFNEALERLASLRRDVAALAGMEAELEALGDANGVAALAGRREAMSREIAAIEGNLSAVRSALCR